jgi:magnesium transporter
METEEIEDSEAVGQPQLLQSLLEEQEYEKLTDLLMTLPEVEVADFLSNTEENEALLLFNRLEGDFKPEVFANFHLDFQIQLIEYFSPKEIADLFSSMSSDDRADIFQNLVTEKQDKILPYLTKPVRDDIINLSTYPKKTAGGNMSSNFATVTKHMTVQQALEQIRHDAPTKETIYYIYVVDAEKQLIGFVSLKDIILAHPNQTIENILNEDVIFSEVNEDQEIAIKKIEKYDLLAIPVVNIERKLVGIITHDDAFDIIRQEQTEDMEKFMGISGEHKLGAYLNTTVWDHFKSRAFWINVLAALGIVSGIIIHNFQDTLTTLILLMLYIPMMSSAGGNSGSQAATVVIRALALGEIDHTDWWRVLFKEFRISLLLGGSLGLWVFLKVYIFTAAAEAGGAHSISLYMIGVAIGIALAVQVISATVLGALLPLIASKFKLDPAVIASPVLSTVVDITGLLLYFTCAKLILGI